MSCIQLSGKKITNIYPYNSLEILIAWESCFCLLLHDASTTFVKEYELNIRVTRFTD